MGCLGTRSNTWLDCGESKNHLSCFGGPLEAAQGLRNIELLHGHGHQSTGPIGNPALLRKFGEDDVIIRLKEAHVDRASQDPFDSVCGGRLSISGRLASVALRSKNAEDFVDLDCLVSTSVRGEIHRDVSFRSRLFDPRYHSELYVLPVLR
jgi:hypothetical protein